MAIQVLSRRPFLIHSLTILTPQGQTLSIKAAGEGPTIMLLHGFPLDHRMWLPQIRELSQSYHVVVPEFRGFGESSLPEAEYTLAQLADDVEFVRQHLAADETIHLAGLSMGGYVAFEYWHKYAHHLQSLTLANTKPTVDDDAAQQGRLAMAKKALEEGTWPAVSPMLEKLLGPTARLNLPEVEQQMIEMMQCASPQAVAAAQHAMAQRRDFSTLLSRIQVPTLVVTGDDDPIAPPDSTERWARKIAGSHFARFAQTGHMTTIEAPEQFNARYAEFLAIAADPR